MFGSKAPTAGAPPAACCAGVTPTEGVTARVGTAVRNDVEIRLPFGVAGFPPYDRIMCDSLPEVSLNLMVGVIVVCWRIDKPEGRAATGKRGEVAQGSLLDTAGNANQFVAGLL